MLENSFLKEDISLRKSLIAAILAVMLSAGVSSAEVAGMLMLFDNDAKEDYATGILRASKKTFFIGVDVSTLELKYYDSLSAMVLALEKGEIDYLYLPQLVGSYVLENNSEFMLKGASWYPKMIADTLNFGFLEKNAELMKKFNDALAGMKKDGTLAILEKAYVNNYGLTEKPELIFENFDGAETITVALTGDLPPVDYVDADGVPAGFNVAVLAEIGRRLNVNIKTIQVDTGARLVALTSGRADAAFWFRENLGVKMFSSLMFERPKGVLISEPYYAWNEFYFIGKK